MFDILVIWDPFYWLCLTLIPAWISNNIHYKVWDENTCPFPNFNGAAVRLQAIIWTNVDQVLWSHMASLGYNELSDALLQGVNPTTSEADADAPAPCAADHQS